MQTAPKLHPAGSASYRGNCTHMVGEVKGPTTYGARVVASAATYDPETDRTRVDFVYGDWNTVEIVLDENGDRTVRPVTVHA